MSARRSRFSYLLRTVFLIPRTRCRVRLIGAPTERPFPSVLGEPSKVTTASRLGQPFFRCSRKQPSNASGIVKTGGGREHLGCSPSSLTWSAMPPKLDWPSGLGARQANLPILRLEFPACQHPRTLSADYSSRPESDRPEVLTDPKPVAICRGQKKSLPVFHSGAPCCPAAVSRDGLVILWIDSQHVNPPE
jgi:hypothetical protein